MHRRREGVVAIAVLLSLLAVGCATTTRTTAPEQATWQASRPAAAAPVVGDGPLSVYVVGFGLSSQVAALYPELAESQVGWGICNRIVESLYDSGRFTFVEEKSEIVERMVALMRATTTPDPDLAQGDVPWLLYGEVVDLQVAVKEQAVGIVGSTTKETRMTIQIRLVDRSNKNFYPATGTGDYAEKVRDWKAGGTFDDLDESSVGAATDEAVRAAAGKLLAVLRTE